MQIQFTDYSILTLLLCLLLLITLIEYKTLRGNELEERIENLKKAAISVYAGMLLTIISGIIVEFKFSNQQDFYFISVPIICILFWGAFYKKASEILSTEAFELEMDLIYQKK